MLYRLTLEYETGTAIGRGMTSGGAGCLEAQICQGAEMPGGAEMPRGQRCPEAQICPVGRGDWRRGDARWAEMSGGAEIRRRRDAW